MVLQDIDESKKERVIIDIVEGFKKVIRTTVGVNELSLGDFLVIYNRVFQWIDKKQIERLINEKVPE